MASDAAVDETDAITRRFGQLAAVEWQVLLNLFHLNDGFALVILTVPSQDSADLCRGQLTSFLKKQRRDMTVLDPADPEALRGLAVTLFALPDDPARGAIWIAAVPGTLSADRSDWVTAWRQALGSLNQQRNALRRRFSQPVIIVGGDDLVPTMREIASDLWSIRSLALWIEPPAGRVQIAPTREPATAAQTTGTTSDPELALRLVQSLRGKTGQEQALARALRRAGEGLAGRYAWTEAEAALREAADLFARFGPEAAAAGARAALGDLLLTTGRSPEALAAYQASLAIADRLAQADPGNAGWQRYLSVLFNKVGDVLVAQGNLTAALKSYRAGLAIADRLAQADPGNAGWQRDLSVSFNKVGDVLEAQGNLPEALNSYQASQATFDRLAQADPGNAGWQRDLSVSFDRVGNVQVAQGNLPEALKSFQASLAIAERLAQADPGNAGWQRDLSISLGRVADTLLKLGRMAEARPLAERALANLRSAIARMPDDPRLARDLAYFEGLVRRSGGAP